MGSPTTHPHPGVQLFQESTCFLKISSPVDKLNRAFVRLVYVMSVVTIKLLQGNAQSNSQVSEQSGQKRAETASDPQQQVPHSSQRVTSSLIHCLGCKAKLPSFPQTTSQKIPCIKPNVPFAFAFQRQGFTVLG